MASESSFTGVSGCDSKVPATRDKSKPEETRRSQTASTQLSDLNSNWSLDFDNPSHPLYGVDGAREVVAVMTPACSEAERERIKEFDEAMANAFQMICPTDENEEEGPPHVDPVEGSLPEKIGRTETGWEVWIDGTIPYGRNAHFQFLRPCQTFEDRF